MGRLSKLALGLVTVSSFFLVAAFVGMLATTILLFPEAPRQGAGQLPDEFFEAFARHFVLVFAAIATLFLAVILAIVMPLVFALHVLKSEGIEGDQKATWVGLFLGGILVAPFYWYLYVWREPPAG